MHTLPEYMKPFYVAMLKLFEEIGKEIDKDQNSLHLQVAIGGVKFLLSCYLFPFPSFYLFIYFLNSCALTYYI